MLNRISLVKKIIVLIIVSVVIPLCIQNYVYYVQTEKNIQNNMQDKLNIFLNEKVAKIEGELSGVVSLAKTYARNESLYRCLDKDYETDLSFFLVYQEEINKLFKNDFLYYRQIRSTMIYTDNKTVLNGAYVRRLETFNKVFSNEKTIGQTEDNLSIRVTWEPKRTINSEERSLSIICLMDYFKQYDKYKKILQIDINTTYFDTILTESSMFDNLILTDSDGRVIASAHSYSKNGNYDIFFPEEAENGIEVLGRNLGNFPLTIYGLYDSKIISDEFKTTRMQGIFITAASLLLAALCILLVLGNITKRIYLIVKQSKEIAKGNFVQIQYDSKGADEISILEKGMNQMSSRLQDLIEKDYRAELSRTQLKQETVQAKLLALQSQINPHFLFNTLESIRLKAMVKGEIETAHMIKYMSRMFRNVINWDENIIRLKDEIDFLYEFLNIQNYRFEDEFEYYIDVEQRALDCLIPKMIVQTLVENACVHGVEAIENNRMVSVTAKVKEEQFELVVEDNGGGMTAERLETLKVMLRGEDEEKISGSVGIYNVYKRLQLYYGEDFLFDIDSVLGKGTKCTIHIPARYQSNTR